MDSSLTKSSLFIEEYESETENLPRRLRKGEIINDDEIDLTLYYNNDKLDKTDVLGVVEFFVVNNRLKLLLQKYDKSFLHFHEVQLYNTKTSSSLTYYLVNIVENLDVIDFDKSDINYYGNTTVIKNVKSLIIKEPSVQRNIFRISGLATQLVISEALKEDLEINNVNGIQYIPINEFTYR